MENKREAVIMLGLPASGKSTYIKEHYIDVNPDNHVIVSADNIRINHPNYDPKHPEAIHEECVELAEIEMYRLASLHTNIVMDGGAINNSYTLRIIKYLRAMYNYHIKVVYINTPVRICIARNNERIIKNERFVPRSAILDKSYMLTKVINNIVPVADEFINVKYFTNKYIFADMDGCLAGYQDLACDEHGNVDFVNNQAFKYAKPVFEIIKNITKNFESNNIFILSASPNSICNADKLDWLKTYMPYLNSFNIFFVGNKNYKTIMLENLMRKLDIKSNEILLLDDDHKTLEDAKKLGVNTMHPSTFLAEYYK